MPHVLKDLSSVLAMANFGPSVVPRMFHARKNCGHGHLVISLGTGATHQQENLVTSSHTQVKLNWFACTKRRLFGSLAHVILMMLENIIYRLTRGHGAFHLLCRGPIKQ